MAYSLSHFDLKRSLNIFFFERNYSNSQKTASEVFSENQLQLYNDIISIVINQLSVGFQLLSLLIHVRI